MGPPVRVNLRTRLLIPLLVLLLADGVATGWAASLAAAREDRRIGDQRDAVARTLTESRSFPLTARVLEQMKGLSGAEFVLIRRGSEPVSTFAETRDEPPRGSELYNHRGEEYQVEWVMLPENHPNAGESLAICYAESLRRTAILEAIRPPLFVGAAFFMVAILVWFLVSGIVGRIRQLETRTRSIAAGEFQTHSVTGPNDELRDLALSIQEMARRLAAFERESKQTERLRVLGQFSGGLAHQLRNAATGAKLAVQLHLKQYPAERDALEIALRQLARIETTLKQFLALGKPEALPKHPLDLADVLDAAIQSNTPQAIHLGMDIRRDYSRPIPFVGDAETLVHLFANLLGNGMDAAGPGGWVELRSIENGIEMIDSGGGPPAELEDRLFETFVTGKEQGIGLGLTVAKQAAEAHNGTLDWFRREETTVFRVRW